MATHDRHLYRRHVKNWPAMDAPAAAIPDDALAQPTRARLFAILTELRGPVGTVELAERLGLHPNGVRIHLERLEAAGFVSRSRAPQTRGRPRDAWTISPTADPGGAPPTGFRELAGWLARTIPARPGRLREVEAAGREIGRELAGPGEAQGGTGTLYSTLAALGFQPHIDSSTAGRTTYCLGNCPYKDSVRANQPVVCTLHRGITRGLLEALEPDARLVDFVPRDPDKAGCIVGVQPVRRTARETS
jgi:predicted ArsR family transcriptional regulator